MDSKSKIRPSFLSALLLAILLMNICMFIWYIAFLKNHQVVQNSTGVDKLLGRWLIEAYAILPISYYLVGLVTALLIVGIFLITPNYIAKSIIGLQTLPVALSIMMFMLLTNWRESLPGLDALPDGSGRTSEQLRAWNEIVDHGELILMHDVSMTILIALTVIAFALFLYSVILDNTVKDDNVPESQNA